MRYYICENTYTLVVMKHQKMHGKNPDFVRTLLVLKYSKMNMDFNLTSYLEWRGISMGRENK